MTDSHMFVAKGLAYLLIAVLIVVHMARSWDETSGWGQRLRYLFLLYLVVSISSASVEQVVEGAVVNSRNVPIFIGAGLGLVTMVVTWIDWRKHRRP